MFLIFAGFHRGPELVPHDTERRKPLGQLCVWLFLVFPVRAPRLSDPRFDNWPKFPRLPRPEIASGSRWIKPISNINRLEFRLFRNKKEIVLENIVPNQSEEYNYNSNLVLFNKIQKVILKTLSFSSHLVHWKAYAIIFLTNVKRFQDIFSHLSKK